ncbi:hypothetical protein AAFC00_003469 [Neodothiora populina]|uniref:Ribosomal lysine N-methyltransferase 4 n=1 Tax=Neodothiora populina TaxID=2781224 RepID=A0ABR3PEU2_9PEZI
MDDDFSERTRSFLSWFQSRRSNISPKIQLADLRYRNSGRGVVATQDIAQDEQLFSISRSDILSVENSRFAHTEVGKSILADLDDQWTPLILVMIFEFLSGDDSQWKPYFDILPTHFNSLMFWSDDELGQLQASAVRQKIGREEANEMFSEKIIPLVRRNTLALFLDASSISDADLLYLAHRMGSTIMSYAFDLEKDPSQQEVDEDGYASDEEEAFLPKGMIPLADMLNADAGKNNARLFYEKSVVTMRALKPIAAGEEIFNDYGPLPRADLLRRYGYITQGHAIYDVVEIPRQLVIDVFRALAPDHPPQTSQEALVTLHCPKSEMTDASLERKFEYLDEYEALDDGYDLSRSPDEGLIPAMLLSLIWTLDLSAADFDSKKDSKPRQASLDPKKKDSMRFFAVLCHIVEARLNQYTTTLADDEQLALVVEQTALNDISEYRKAMALHVRIGEKQILHSALLQLTNARDEAIRKHGRD